MKGMKVDQGDWGGDAPGVPDHAGYFELAALETDLGTGSLVPDVTAP